MQEDTASSTKFVKLTASIKILIVAPHIWDYVGGAEKIIRQICGVLEKFGFEFYSITNDDLDTKPLNYNLNFEIPIGSKPRNEVHEVYKKANIIVACGFTSLRLLREHKIDTPIIFMPFETVELIDRKDSYYCRDVLLSLNIKAVVVFSLYFKKLIKVICGFTPVWIKYNLPDTEQLSSITFPKKNEVTTKKIVFVPTRISPRKNIEDIIYVAEKLKDLKLSVVVSGGLNDTPYRDYAEKIRGLNNSLGFPVYFSELSMTRQEVIRHYFESFCVLSTSRIEGFGIFALEALNYLKPIISYDSTGIKELAGLRGFGSCGIRIVYGVKDMAKEIRTLHNDERIFLDRRRLLADFVNRYNQTYSFELQIKKLLISC
jgi:glycosyltransferase involved in cell wall biosynthesis